MQNKLQELTEQLYNEGLAKGREEGDRYLPDFINASPIFV